MSEKTKTAAPPAAEKAEGRTGGLRNARPEVQALARITGILDRLDDEQRSRTLDLVGQTYDRLSGGASVRSITVGTMDVSAIMDRLREQVQLDPGPITPEAEDRKVAALREENHRLREQLRGSLAGSPLHPAGSPLHDAFVHNPKPQVGGYASEEPRGTNRTETARVG